jgi:pimeloyl-ACP methyl ester carboxylesterase
VPRLVLVPGLAARGFLYEPQRAAFPQLEVIEWIPHRPRETLAAYAQRLAATVPTGPEPHNDIVLGGVSFGAMAALEMARHLQPRMPVRAVVLISGSTTPMAIRPTLRAAALAAPYLPARLLHPLRVPIVTSTRWLLGPLTPDAKRLVTRLAHHVNTPFALWSYGAMARWTGLAEPGCPVQHLHGQSDRITPISNVSPDRTVANAGHLVNVTHPSEVNEFLAECLAMHSGPPKTPPTPDGNRA